MKIKPAYIVIATIVIVVLLAYMFRNELKIFLSGNKVGEVEKSLNKMSEVVQHLPTPEGQKILDDENAGLVKYGYKCNECQN